MPIQIIILSAAYLVAAALMIIKYTGTGLYANLATIGYGDILRGGLPFFLIFLGIGLLLKRPSVRKTAVYWVFSQYIFAAYCALQIGTSGPDDVVKFGSWAPMFLNDLAARSPWQAVAIIFGIAATQNWALSHESTTRVFGETI